jgi:tripartite-type tricarboxylate transporter receptor subunit TctC
MKSGTQHRTHQSSAPSGSAKLLGMALLCLALESFAQTFPVKPIRVVVPNPAGGIDSYARVFQPKFVEIIGQQMLLENRPGASGAIGGENVARSAPDGYSLLFATSGVMVTGPFLNKSLPFDTVRDFAPISILLEPVEVLAVHAALPFKSVKDLIVYAKSNPGKLTFGSSGMGSVPHFDGELVKGAAGIDMLHVPYKGIAQIIPELVAGRIDVAYPGIGSVMPHVTSGKVRMLAVLAPTRFARQPDVPSITETLPGFRPAPLWFGMFAPAATPRPIVQRLHSAFVAALNSPEVRANYESSGFRVIGSSPEELSARMKADSELTAGLVKAIGLKPE